MRRTTFVATYLAVALAATLAFPSPVTSVERDPQYMPPTPASISFNDVVTIVNNRGGYVDEFLRDADRLKKTGTKVRIAGSCDSACTLYLSLPKGQVCAYGNVTFAFHKPYGGSKDAYWERMMMRSYPLWVRAWIKRKGGLTDYLKVMTYKDYYKYVPRCA